MFKFILIVVLGAIWMNVNIVLGNKPCSAVWSMNYSVLWPSASNLTLSRPPCVNKVKEFLYRECQNGDWSPEPDCYYVQEKTPPECPVGFNFDARNGICYQISKNSSKFPPECPFHGLLAFNLYRSLINNLGPVWMPIKRDLHNGLGYMQWIESSELYKIDFQEDYKFDGGIKGKNCLLFYNSSFIVATSCNEQHLSVCAYPKFSSLLNQLCRLEDSCFPSTFDTASKCFCVGNSSVVDESEFKKAELLQHYQNNLSKRLIKNNYTIALLKLSNGTYIWNNVLQEIDYTNWATDVVFDNSHIYGALSSKGWILTKQPLQSFLYVKQIEVQEPTLTLSFNPLSNILVLTVSHQEGLKRSNLTLTLYCFTDADSFKLLHRFTNFTQEWENGFQFEPLHDGPGNYWCEAFKITTMEPISSNAVLVRQNQFEFIALIKINSSLSLNPLTPQFFQIFVENLFSVLNERTDLEELYIYRFMKIVDVNETGHEVIINIHFTHKSKSRSDKDHDEEFEYVNKILQELPLKVVNFLSVDYCMTIYDPYTWPNTSVGQWANCLEYCFRPDGSRLNRFCQGDFINGAQWAELEGECQIPPYSNVTLDLIPLVTYQDPIVVEMLLNITKNYQQFLPVDVYLTGTLLNGLCAGDVNLTTLGTIINNLLEINEEVLLQSQLVTRALDQVLEAIKKHIVGNTFEKYVEFQAKNFYFVLTHARDHGGVEMPVDASTCTSPVKLMPGADLEALTIYNASSAILLPADFIKKIDSDQRINMAIFCKTSFFIKKSKQAPRTVFALTTPGLNDVYLGDIWLVQNHESNSQDCSVWLNSWAIKDHSLDIPPFQVCQFRNNEDSHFFSMTPENVTQTLIDILDSDLTTSEVIVSLNEVSKKYEEFCSNDITLVGKILDRVSQESSEVDLEAFAQIVGNLHLIKHQVLKESYATDTILQLVDGIIKNHDFNSQVQIFSNSSFMIVVSDVRDSDFSGVVLMEDNQLELLFGNVTPKEVAAINSVQSAVVLDVDLKKQLKRGDKVIITLFPNDVLFNGKSNESNSVGNIFGIILPDLQEYAGPISVLHQVLDKNYRQDCAHWAFADESASYWDKDQEGRYLSNLTLCQFWHTTHFALLLLDYVVPDDLILTWITNINCVLSTFGLLGIITTALLFKSWRNNVGNQILLNFTLVMMFQMILFFISSTVNDGFDYISCTIIGLVLHYVTISQFCWVLVVAFLQFKRFVIVFGGPSRSIMLKSCLIGWGIPLLPVSLVFFLDGNYVNGTAGLCYPSGLSLYLAVWFPIMLIIIANVIIFIYIMFNVVCKNRDCYKVGNNDASLQWRLALLLFFMLGLTWIFGFFAELNMVFVYLFCTTATLQGFVIFLFFIVFNHETRSLYRRFLQKVFKDE